MTASLRLVQTEPFSSLEAFSFPTERSRHDQWQYREAGVRSVSSLLSWIRISEDGSELECRIMHTPPLVIDRRGHDGNNIRGRKLGYE